MKYRQDRDLYEKRKPPHGHMAKDILRYLATGVAIYIICSSPSGTRRLLKNIKKEWNRRSALEAMERLRKHKLLLYKEKKDGTLVVTIAQKGKIQVQEWDIDNLTIEKPKKWDRRYRVLAFDISEQRKQAREAFRRMIKHLGFIQLQRSLFAHPFSCRAQIELLLKVFSIPEEEVLYFSSDRLSPDYERKIKKQFCLP